MILFDNSPIINDINYIIFDVNLLLLKTTTHRKTKPRIHKIGTLNPNKTVLLKKVKPFNVIPLIAIIGNVNGNTIEKYCNPKGIPSIGHATPKIKELNLKL